VQGRKIKVFCAGDRNFKGKRKGNRQKGGDLISVRGPTGRKREVTEIYRRGNRRNRKEGQLSRKLPGVSGKKLTDRSTASGKGGKSGKE